MKLTNEIIDAETARVVEAVRMAAPEVPTKRMWEGIRARLAAGEGLELKSTSKASVWARLLETLSAPSPALRWGGALAAVFLLALGLNLPRLGNQQSPIVRSSGAEKAPSPIKRVSQPAAVPKARASAPQPVAAARAPRAAKLELDEPAQKGPTEVEQALADQDVNQAMNRVLEQKESVGAGPYMETPLAASTVSLGGASASPRSMASSMAPAARLMPLQPVGPNGLNVQAAGSQQYFANNRIVVYTRGVVARMTGLRGEGDVLQLDLSSGQASFGPGTHFVRLASDSGETAVKIFGGDGSEIKENEFNAPRGADYDAASGELRLK